MPQTYTVTALRRILDTIPLDKPVRSIVLFGSYAKGTALPDSDIDFYLDSNRQITGFAYFELKGKLEEAFQREIDLIPDVDVIPGSLVDYEIRRTGVSVYAR